MNKDTAQQNPGDVLSDVLVLNPTEDTLLSSLGWMCTFHHIEMSPAALVAGVPKMTKVTPTAALTMLEHAGLSGAWTQRKLSTLSPYLFPVIALRKDGRHMVIAERITKKNQTQYRVILPETGLGEEILDDATMQEECDLGYFLLVKAKAKLSKENEFSTLDDRSKHWLLGTFLKYRKYYYSAALAAILANILTLAGTFFTMNVYDRIIPTQAYASLWALGIGVIIAIVFEFIVRQVRAHLVDQAGKKIDLVLGSFLFHEFLITRMEYQPQSTGSFANQFREFESIRDFMSSATLATLSDIPFGILFLVIIYFIGGPLVLVPLMLVPIILVVSVFVQWPLSRIMKENLRESSLKQGLLIESISGIETLKSAHGESVMQKKWDEYSALSAATSMKTRSLTSTVMGLVQTFQQLTTVVMVIYGAYLIGAGTLSQGALIGSVILTGRVISPLASLMGLAVRFQQAKVAVSSLNRFVALAIEKEEGKDYLSKPRCDGNLTLKQVSFAYPTKGTEAMPKIIKDISIDIKAGEKIAILGSIGSGKSTLLRILAGLYQPTDGQLLIDGIDAKQIEPADVRQGIGFLGQDARLFQGTLKENITLGNPIVTTEVFLEVARIAGVDLFASKHPLGYGMPVGEMGSALSGGQRQLVALARCLLLQPQVLLMDEPTSAMDQQTERLFLQRLHAALSDQTVVIATHRHSVLNVVDRIIVLDDGKKVADGPKEVVLQMLQNNSRKAATATTA